ncbi:hypothetical protein BpHYR1_012514 [Brachionus plicatilis]|uniref:Uncharacterized protein n=1 Tax=Brachionus plicatilis TaxID=10195 RepID=A0A3M7Q3L5_BRAPC|nr:hypothetical protein BpHYR1_012514 [Brachionus plicatilis]
MTFDFLHYSESLDEFKRLIKDLRFDNIAWNFHLTNRLADCDNVILTLSVWISQFNQIEKKEDQKKTLKALLFL